MSASIESQAIPGGFWLVAQGSRRDVFRALGEHAREPICDVVANATGLGNLRERLSRSDWLAHQFDAVAHKSRSSYPDIWTELEYLASGAGVAFEDVLLLNLRGDLGTDDGTGCTDMAWTGRSRSLLAHNEDGDPGFLGQCNLLTLLIDEDPAVTAWWYPGCLPSNAYGFNEHGLCWGIDNVNVNRPAAAAGRHFVARSAQRASDLDEFVHTLQSSPSAGGFAYTIGSMRSGSIAVLETAAGWIRQRRLDDSSRNCVWHTNHLMMLDSVADTPSRDSLARAARLSELPMPDEPDRDSMLRLFSEDSAIGGVRTGTATLSTVVYDLTDGDVAIKIGSGRPILVPGDQPSTGRAAFELLRTAMR